MNEKQKAAEKWAATKWGGYENGFRYVMGRDVEDTAIEAFLAGVAWRDKQPQKKVKRK